MSADELFGLHDGIETEPADLQDLYVKVMTSLLSKGLAPLHGKQWTEALETEYQEKVSALVAAAKSKGLSEFTVIAVKPDGRRVRRVLSVDKIDKQRVLQ
jgi:hypothetical protein